MQVNDINIISKYRIAGELGESDFGRTYRGEDTTHKDSIVAVKMLRPVLLVSTQIGNSFLQDAQFLKMLKHPYILPTLDIGIDKQLPYLTTKYMTDGSLQSRLGQVAPRPLPVQEAVSILSQVGQALHYAHQQDIIHRDLKPTNILFSAAGDALLSDFGIDAMLAAGTKRGLAMTTALYMAPEQFRGTFNKETDQYALGCIAYELLTGRPPFSATDFFSLGYKHTMEAPIAPTQLNLLLPRSLEQAILKAIAKNPADRHADIAAFLTALGVPLPQTLSPMNARISPEAYDRPETPSSLAHRQGYQEETGKMVALTKVFGDTPPTVAVPIKEKSVALLPADDGSSAASTGSDRKKSWALKHKWLIATMLLLTLLLISSGALYAMSVQRTTTSVLITPSNTTLSSIYTISAITDKPDATHHQVQARRLSSTSSTFTNTAPATGQETTPPTYATGTLLISNPQTTPQTFPSNRYIPNTDSTIAVITDTAVTVPAANGNQPGTAKVSAHAVKLGASGNIAAGSINYCCSGAMHISNPSAFSGGTDAMNTTIVLQNDQYNAAYPLEGTLTRDTQSSLNAQIRSNEKLVGSIACTPTVYYSNVAGSKATNVIATVSVTCTGEVYDQQEAQVMAANLLKNSVSSSSSNTSSIRAEKITTAVIQANAVDTTGTITLLIKAKSTPSFLLSTVQKRNLAKLIAGKNEKKAQAILLKQIGMNQAIFKFAGDNNQTLPADPNRITITVSS